MTAVLNGGGLRERKRELVQKKKGKQLQLRGEGWSKEDQIKYTPTLRLARVPTKEWSGICLG